MNETVAVVLLVEGDIVVRHPLAQYLRECGFKVIESATGAEAIHSLSNTSIVVDVVLADMTTTGSGFALRQAILAIDPSIDVILAGSFEKTVEKAGNLCNAGPALAKPWDHRLVLEQIKLSLAKRPRRS